jgi:hypothetical protein
MIRCYSDLHFRLLATHWILPRPQKMKLRQRERLLGEQHAERQT